MGLTILCLTILLAVILGVIISNLWISYALILVLLGGLLVVFIYVSLLASNELFQKKNFITPLILFFFTFVSILFFIQENLFLDSRLKSLKFIQCKGNEWLISLYSTELCYLTIFLILYLLLTLIVVVAVTKSDNSSLRSLN